MEFLTLMANLTCLPMAKFAIVLWAIGGFRMSNPLVLVARMKGNILHWLLQLANSARTIPVRVSTGISVSLASRDLSPEAPEFKVTAVSLAKSTLSKPTTEMISASRAKMEKSRTIRSAAPCVFPSNSVLTDFISMILESDR